MPKPFYEIQFIDVENFDGDMEDLHDSDQWEVWDGDTDAVELLKAFVSAVSHEHIDEFNKWWRVITTDA